MHPNPNKGRNCQQVNSLKLSWLRGFGALSVLLGKGEEPLFLSATLEKQYKKSSLSSFLKNYWWITLRRNYTRDPWAQFNPRQYKTSQKMPGSFSRIDTTFRSQRISNKYKITYLNLVTRRLKNTFCNKKVSRNISGRLHNMTKRIGNNHVFLEKLSRKSKTQIINPLSIKWECGNNIQIILNENYKVMDELKVDFEKFSDTKRIIELFPSKDLAVILELNA